MEILNSIHRVPLSCLSDAYCSADWVVNKLEQHGYNIDRMNALGSYHSKTPSLKAIYIEKLERYLIK